MLIGNYLCNRLMLKLREEEVVVSSEGCRKNEQNTRLASSAEELVPSEGTEIKQKHSIAELSSILGSQFMQGDVEVLRYFTLVLFLPDLPSVG